MKTFASRLEETLEMIITKMDCLLDTSEIQCVQDNSDQGILATIPEFSWKSPDGKQLLLQRELLEIWTLWVALLRLLFSNDTEKKQSDLEKTIKRAEVWIHQDQWDHSIPKTIAEAKQVFREKVMPLREALVVFHCENPTVFLIPDTNILIKHPEVETYGKYIGVDEYTVWLVPTVLQEIDQHKVNHRVEEVREKAKKFSNRLKGWRNQGQLATGVKVQGAVFIRAEGKEPDFKKTISWLQLDIQDDRILASVLEIQRRFPSAVVVLVTSDTNMLTKADAALIQTADFED
jgi:hypothetical protein